MSWNDIEAAWEIENLRQLALRSSGETWPISWDYKAVDPTDATSRCFGHATGPQVHGGRMGSDEFTAMGEQIIADAHFQAACVEFVRRYVIP